jgi:large subunit ribosomal protein L13
MKTTRPADPGAARGWLVVDANNKVLGRLAVTIANALRGKDNPAFEPSVDLGRSVVVINAEKVKLTGRKEETKAYQTYSGWRGGQKSITIETMRERHPDRIIKLAVRGMLPKNTLSRKLMTRLKVYKGAEHPHAAQAPEVLKV